MSRNCPPTPRTVEASPGPWLAHVTSFPSGTVMIEDADGEIIGFATDAAGHTTENTPPDRRLAAVTLLNGHRMAAAWITLDVLKSLVALAPAVLHQLADGGGQAHGGFLHALDEARQIIESDRAISLLAVQCVRVPA